MQFGRIVFVLANIAGILVADGLQVAGDLLTAEPEQVRNVLAHGMRNVLDRIPNVSAQDSRDIAKGIAGLHSAIRGWMA